ITLFFFSAAGLNTVRERFPAPAANTADCKENDVLNTEAGVPSRSFTFLEGKVSVTAEEPLGGRVAAAAPPLLPAGAPSCVAALPLMAGALLPPALLLLFARSLLCQKSLMKRLLSTASVHR
ncbi:unnamed protein product, partial [Ixodes pacificus]